MTGRILALCVALIWGSLLAVTATAQGFSALARVDAERSLIRDAGQGARIELHLSQGVPYRIFTLDGPPRLVLDFQEVDWAGLDQERLLQGENLRAVHFGAYVPGWSRMVLDLGRPMQVEAAEMAVDPVTAAAVLSLDLQRSDAAAFAASAGAPKDRRWDLPAPEALNPAAPRDANAPLVVVLDPGHGGIDPGAQVEGGVDEKSLMLEFAFELGEMLVRSGQFSVQLTRDGDYFVSLERRIALAHQAGADLFISLHADSLSEGGAHGSTVYTLSKDASDAASAKLAERHDRSDLLAGTDLTAADDLVTDVLLDLARQETQPRSEALARSIVDGLRAQGGPLNRRPLRAAGFSVLKSADTPSVLVEIGFLSSQRDLKNLLDPAWRTKAARGILAGLIEWRIRDEAQRPLVRQ
ncbi:N-acetylmuramoyl-L-alanine amidase [Phaeobacter sp. QD34_3]|uniref:N-acetylmuramoyl-L-alanine amidase n=1 Tax=unclassified Phaeobacter TaxID=2621772 RepID=UPI00237F114B|nr:MULTISPECIES: N-acetylmuramoyl-L-alanine amidase [unclassified Phaeobacter]MDE4134470.1 N-acetylmuramoyl-L-alanine amidase [Phaeobacter sp. QD34_3]MDE4138140.1 N-acetylmuramoyl-L-alanine amidase [Phaeobacter sp. QD34_24]MDE4175829.1 N-acetylmuramoyl-L-alanine amidase [Phaeobacter sp. PT47_59]